MWPLDEAPPKSEDQLVCIPRRCICLLALADLLLRVCLGLVRALRRALPCLLRLHEPVRGQPGATQHVDAVCLPLDGSLRLALLGSCAAHAPALARVGRVDHQAAGRTTRTTAGGDMHQWMANSLARRSRCSSPSSRPRSCCSWHSRRSRCWCSRGSTTASQPHGDRPTSRNSR